MPSEHEDRLRQAETAALFRTAPVGVLGALAGGVVLGGALLQLGHVSQFVVLTWVAILAADAACHLLLFRLYARSRGGGANWRRYLLPFDLVSLAEGLTWGVGSIVLMGAGALDLQLFVMIVVVGVAAGAVTSFGSRPRAAFLFLLPTMAPFTIWTFTRGDVLHVGLGLLSLVYIGAITLLAKRAYATIAEALRLRFENLELVEDLRRRKEIAEQANLAKSRFLAAASHDLRQPIHALGMFVGALRGCDMDLEARRLLGHVETSVSAMDGLFGSLLDISRLDGGVVQVRLQAFRIGPVLERVCRDYEAEARGKGLRLVLIPSSAVVHSDPILIERVLRNLVSNAVRYTDRGRVMVGCRSSARLSVEVWDSGCGIARDQQNRIFEEFYQLDNPERDRAKGLGLGLAIVRRLATLLECPLSVHSEPGRGSVFKIAIPLSRQPYAQLSRTAAEATVHRARPGRILVVDDETAIQEAMRSLLTSWGHEVTTAGSCAEMLAKMPSTGPRPDLVICDYRLRADENGIEVVGALRRHFAAEVPAMLITGDTAPDRLAEARASGLLILHKPVANAKLRAAIGNLIGKPAADVAELSAMMR